jgi:hypothetical protein
MDWRSVCRRIDDSCWTVCGGTDGCCWTVCAGIGGSRGGVLCAINCFGAPLVGARGFLGFRPLLFGMEREPAAPAGSTLYTFQDIAEYMHALPSLRSISRPEGARLRSPLSTLPVGIFVPTFPQRSPLSLLTTAACGGLRSAHLIADLEGPSFISRTVTHRRLDRRYS